MPTAKCHVHVGGLSVKDLCTEGEMRNLSITALNCFDYLHLKNMVHWFICLCASCCVLPNCRRELVHPFETSIYCRLVSTSEAEISNHGVHSHLYVGMKEVCNIKYVVYCLYFSMEIIPSFSATDFLNPFCS